MLIIIFIFKTYIEHFHEVLGENIQYVFHIQALSKYTSIVDLAFWI